MFLNYLEFAFLDFVSRCGRGCKVLPGAKESLLQEFHTHRRESPKWEMRKLEVSG